MIRKYSELKRIAIHATDGEIGNVADLLLDDRSWTVRYVVANTGGWLKPERHVLIATSAVETVNEALTELPVRLTRAQVEGSPGVELDRPVSRQMEHQLHEYYDWDPYWAFSTVESMQHQNAPGPFPELLRADLEERIDGDNAPDEDPHLRSVDELIGYRIRTRDGEFGEIEDLILEDDIWAVRYLVIRTRRWLAGQTVLVSPEWEDCVSWQDEELCVDLESEAIGTAPPYDPDLPLVPAYERTLMDHYSHWESHSTQVT